jgi:hypothetical protein
VSVSDYLWVRKWDGRFFLCQGTKTWNSRTWSSAEPREDPREKGPPNPTDGPDASSRPAAKRNGWCV